MRNTKKADFLYLFHFILNSQQMKSPLLFLLAILLTVRTSAQNGTCLPPVGVDCVTIPDYIDSAATTYAAANFTNNGTDCNAQDQDYQDYANKIAGEYAGGSFNLHIGLNHAVPAYLGVWVDWNQDLIFGSGEQVYLSPAPVVMQNIAVNVPLTAVQDTLIMRIRCGPVSMGPCDSLGSGETEDYRLIVLDAASGINNAAENFTWNIYPDPANDFLFVEMENTPAEISVFDLAGKEVAKAFVESGKGKINVSGLPRGMYFVRVNANGSSSVKKFVH